MPSQTNEQALEAAIEKRLTGTCLEELQDKGFTYLSAEEHQEMYRGGNGYFIGAADDYNPEYAID